MTAGLHEVIQARENVVKAALDLLRAERELSDERASATAVTSAEDHLALASRDLVRATDNLPYGRLPKGWAEMAGEVL